MAGLWDSNVLNEELFKNIASKIDDGVTPVQLSVYLGFEESQGNNAQNLSSDLQSAYVKLLRIFESNYGKDGKSALKLRIKFLEKDMVPCVELVEEELDKYRITYPSRAGTVISEPLNLPSTSNVKPELKKAGIVIPSPADTPTRQDVNPPSPPRDKPGSETPVTPSPIGRPEELQQQPPSISRDMIADTVNSQALDLPSSSHVKPGSETPVLPTRSDLQSQPRDPTVEPHQQQLPYFGSGWIFAGVFAIIAVIVYFVNVKVP